MYFVTNLFSIENAKNSKTDNRNALFWLVFILWIVFA